MARIALLTNYPRDSGIGRYSFTLFRELNKIIKNDNNADIIDLYRFDRKIRGLYKIEGNDEVLIGTVNGLLPLNNSFFGKFRFSNLLNDFLIGSHIPQNYDLYHITNQNISNMNYYKNIRSAVITVHDIHFITCPSYLTQKLSGTLIYKGIKNCKFIISISKSTKRDIIQYLKIPSDKIKVIYHGIDRTFRPLKESDLSYIYRELNLDNRYKYILHVGADTLRKNFATLLKAIRKLVDNYNLKNIKLIKIGKINNNTRNLIGSLNLEQYVKVVYFVPEEDLVKFYNLAEVFVFPSLQEGFGFPVLEAMACGCPVITSNTSSLPEVVGDAGIMIDPKDIKGFAGAIYNVLADESFRKELSKKGLKRAKKFTWEKCAKETLNVYREALNYD